MSSHYRRNPAIANRRKSSVLPVFIREQEESVNSRRLSIGLNAQRRYSTVSQLRVPGGLEYHQQDYTPPTGIENQSTFVVEGVEDDQTIGEDGRLSIVSHIYSSSDKESIDQDEKKGLQVLYIIEPIISGLLLFPILVLFWECGWNLILIFLNHLNEFPSNLHLEETTQQDFESFTWQSLVYPYLIVQFLLFIYYLGQNITYNFLSNQNWIIRTILLKFYILLLATIYVIQWEMLWTIWDQFTPHEWYFELTLSFASIFALIVFIGHLSDLVCSPFLFSYDSIECCIHFGCPLLTKEMKEWKINLINYVLYEIVISNLSIITWRGLYHYLDDHLYPDDLVMSGIICIIIGYLLYFPLMYFQTYLEQLNLKYEFWTFVSINFPQFYRNIRHLLAFLSCVFAWRGCWLLYDNYVYIFEEYYKTYLLIYILSFCVLSLLNTSSSINGPLSSMEDENEFFPLYPHCYVSTVHKELSQLSFFKQKAEEENTKL